MQILSPPELLEYLHRNGLVADAATADIQPLTGGVSSEIHVVKTPGRSFAIKQALEKLRVRDDWRCDRKRNLYEQDFLTFAQAVLPGSVPEIVHRDRERGLFVMEYLDGRWTTWKARLWAGEISRPVAAQAGTCLGLLHREAWGRKDLAHQFDNTPLFHELRISPYLLTTGERHPDLAPFFEKEARRLALSRVTLVHGDYSPKNLLTDGDAVKIIDAEVAWFGDPAFDISFLISHLLLKAVRFPGRAGGYAELREEFLQAYKTSLATHWNNGLEHRAARLTLMLMMARISGKSPVEYFAPGSREARFILQFAAARIPSEINRFSEIFDPFQHALSDENHPH